MKYPKECENLHEKILFYVSESRPITREQIEVTNYKIASVKQEIWGCKSKFLMVANEYGYLSLTKLGNEKLEAILNKDMTRFSSKRVLAAFRVGDQFTIRDVLYHLRVDETPSRMNTVRTRLRSLIGCGKIVRVGLGDKKQILYAKATNENGQIRHDSIGKQLLLRKEEQAKKLSVTRDFQLALPGDLTAINGLGRIDVLRHKKFRAPQF